MTAKKYEKGLQLLYHDEYRSHPSLVDISQKLNLVVLRFLLIFCFHRQNKTASYFYTPPNSCLLTPGPPDRQH